MMSNRIPSDRHWQGKGLPGMLYRAINTGACHAVAGERFSTRFRPPVRVAAALDPFDPPRWTLLRGTSPLANARKPPYLPFVAHFMIPDEEPVDLEPLGDFLDSARAPE